MAFLLAIIPVVLTVALGWLLAARQIITRPQWDGVESLTYLILFPAMIVRALWEMDVSAIPLGLAGALWIAQSAVGLMAWVAHRAGWIPRGQTGVVIQSNMRFNTFVGLSVIGGALGPEALIIAAFGVAAWVPFSNVVVVAALVHYAPEEAKGRASMVRGLVTNPIIIALVIGLSLAAARITPPAPIAASVGFLGDAAIGCGLLAAGAAVDMKALRRAGLFTFFWALVRLLVLPAIALGVGLWFGLSGVTLAVTVILAATPTAASGVVLARKLNNDATLAANLIAVQTVLCGVTMPLVFWVSHATALHAGSAF